MNLLPVFECAIGLPNFFLFFILFIKGSLSFFSIYGSLFDFKSANLSYDLLTV